MERSFLDRLVGFVSPRAEMNRIAARIGRENLLRAYDAAGSGRRASGWRSSAGSGRAVSEGAMTSLRNRCRDLARNNPLAASLAGQFSGRVVGTGIEPRFRHRAGLVERRAAEAWKRFADTADAEGLTDWYGLASLAARSMFDGGESLLRWRVDDAGRWTVQVLEGDHLDESMDSRGALLAARTAGDVRAGIEMKDGRRAGYWLFPEHPGDAARPFARSERVDADFVDHLFERARPGQMRGLPWLAPAALRMKNFDQIAEAIEMRKRLEACIGIAIESAEAGMSPAMGAQKKDDAGRAIETMSPGMILRTSPGDKVHTIDPASTGDVVGYQRAATYVFCAMVGVPYHAATGDVSEANYSSQRAAVLAGNIVIDQVQWLTVIPRICRPAVRRVLRAAAMATGDARLLEVDVDWSCPVRPWVDPVKEVMGKVLEIRAGLQSMPDALAERGQAWRQHIEDVAAFVKEVDAMGLVFDTDGRQVTKTGAAANIGSAAEQTVKDSIKDTP